MIDENSFFFLFCFASELPQIEAFWRSEVKQHRYETKDGLHLDCAEVVPPGAREQLLIIPGRGETAHKYAEFFYELSALGIRAAVLFVRGQGTSSRLLADPQKCHIGSFADLLSDVRLFASCLGYASYGLLAFSFGCLISLAAMKEGALSPARVCLIAPYLWPNTKYSPWQLRLIAAAGSLPWLRCRFTPYGKAYRDIPFDQNYHCHCKERYEAYHAYYREHPELTIGAPTFGFLHEATAQQLRLFASDSGLKAPCLFMPAAQDRVVLSSAAAAFCKKHQHDAAKPCLESIEGSWHDVINEVDSIRNPALARALNFIFGDTK